MCTLHSSSLLRNLPRSSFCPPFFFFVFLLCSCPNVFPELSFSVSHHHIPILCQPCALNIFKQIVKPTITNANKKGLRVDPLCSPTLSLYPSANLTAHLSNVSLSSSTRFPRAEPQMLCCFSNIHKGIVLLMVSVLAYQYCYIWNWYFKVVCNRTLTEKNNDTTWAEDLQSVRPGGWNCPQARSALAKVLTKYLLMVISLLYMCVGAISPLSTSTLL